MSKAPITLDKYQLSCNSVQYVLFFISQSQKRQFQLQQLYVMHYTWQYQLKVKSLKASLQYGNATALISHNHTPLPKE